MGTGTEGALTRGGAGAAAEAERLVALEALRLLDTPREERFDRITRLCARVLGVPMAAVSLVADDRQWFKSSVGLAISGTPRTDAFCSRAIEGADTYVVEDAATDSRFSANPLVTGEPHVRFYAGQPIAGPGGLPVGTLCVLDDKPRILSENERQTLKDLASWVEKELIRTDELERATAVQRALLPSSPPVVPGFDIAGVCLPAGEVGGDFYDWHSGPYGTVNVTLADVMGKGIGAAIVMATARAALRAGGRDASLAAAVALSAAALEDDLLRTGTFVTAFCARLDPGDSTVAFVDAGHGLAMAVRAGGAVEALDGGGLPLGIAPDQHWDQGRIRLDPGDCLLVCSDGVLEAFGADRAGFHQIGARYRWADSPNNAVHHLAWEAFQRHPDDDVTVAAIRRRPA